MAERTNLKEAIAELVPAGSSVYVTGFTHLIGFAAAHEIIRQRIEDLTLIRLTPDVVYDQMVAAGSASHLVFSYLGNPGVGNLHAIRRAIENGELAWTEYTHGSLIAALRAAASDLPFAPAVAVGGTDLMSHNPAYATVEDPFGGGEVTVVAPLRPDVAIVHVQAADRRGNVRVWGSTGDIREAAMAAERVIVTAEELVDEAELRSDPNRTLLLGANVEAIAVVPMAAHPSYAQGMYARDNRFYREWAERSSTREGAAEYLEREVYGLSDREAYCELHAERLSELRQVGEKPAEPVNFGINAAIADVQE